MATISKNTVNSIAATAWDGGIGPTTTDVATIGASAIGLSEINPWSNPTTAPRWGALYLSSAYTPSTFGFVSGANGANLLLSSGDTVSGGYELYIDDNKTLYFDKGIGPNSGAGIPSTHKWYIGNNAGLYMNPSNSQATYGVVLSVGSSSPSNMRIEKYGPGYMYIGRGDTPTAGTTQELRGGITIRNGAVWLDGFNMVNPIGSSNGTNVPDPTLVFNPDSISSTPTLRYINYLRTSRTVPNNVRMDGAGTITVDSGFTATMTGTLTGAGTLTVAGSGALVWNNATFSAPLNVTGNLTISGTNNITSTAIAGTGSGTVTMNGGTISSSTVSVPNIAGNFTVGGTTSIYSSNITGTVNDITGTNVTFTGTSSGAVTAMGAVTVTLSGSGQFNTASGTTTLIATTLNISGPTAGFASGRTLEMNSATITLQSGAIEANPLTANANTNSVTLQSTGAGITNTYSGNFSTNQTSGVAKVQSAASNVMLLSGAFTSSGRTYSLNADVGYTGTLRVTGTGFSGAAATLNRGTLALSGSSAKGIGTTLNVESGATVTHLTSGPLTGNLNLKAGTIFKFATAA